MKCNEEKWCSSTEAQRYPLEWQYESLIKQFNLVCSASNISLRERGENITIVLAPIVFILITTLSDYIGRRNGFIFGVGFYLTVQLLYLFSNDFMVKMVALGLSFSMDDILYSFVIMGGLESINRSNSYKEKIGTMTYGWN